MVCKNCKCWDDIEYWFHNPLDKNIGFCTLWLMIVKPTHTCNVFENKEGDGE